MAILLSLSVYESGPLLSKDYNNLKLRVRCVSSFFNSYNFT